METENPPCQNIHRALSYQGRKGTGRRAFTLVELIIVITILAILATIAFMSFQGYTSKSRDSNRATTAKNIETGLELFQTKAGVYPIQSTGATISVGGSGITVQGNLDESIARVINLNEVPKDPKTGEPYNYISDTKGRGGKVLYYLENTPDYAFLSHSYADNEVRTPVVKGQGPGVLLDTGSQMVTKSVDLFGAQSGTTYTILVSDSIKIPGTGLDLGGGFQNFAEKGGRLDAPKTCKEGFIPVLGNAEFMQPGFCVAKYEMKQITSSDTYCTYGIPCGDGDGIIEQTDVPIGNSIVSHPSGTSIRRITQEGAIQACRNMGDHLITNNEWMTIARNIEKVSENWTGKSVGSGFVYNGNVSGNDFGIPAGTDENELLKTTGTVLTDNRRALKLSNEQVIWDLSGNVREHVNKANTINGINFNQGQTILLGSSSTRLKDDDGIYDLLDMKRYGSILGLGFAQGMGNISAAMGVANNVLIRGGNADVNDFSGIFTMTLDWNSTGWHAVVGFRCAY